MLDLNLEDLDLGSRRKSTEWVAFAPAALPRKKGRCVHAPIPLLLTVLRRQLLPLHLQNRRLM